jgi:hypothetical protein
VFFSIGRRGFSSVRETGSTSKGAEVDGVEEVGTRVAIAADGKEVQREKGVKHEGTKDTKMAR